ncbi:hypothetical protein GEMRC1_012290 [Eukaryota sp. GEM-RC1]
MRYDRQSLLPQFSQGRLADARVLVVGAGGLGSCLLLHLAGAGVATSSLGSLHVMDADTVSLDNLHRQVIHRTQDVGINKAASAVRAISDLNADVNVTFSRDFLSVKSIEDLITSFNLVIDCTDNLPTKVLLNDACMAKSINFLTASAVRWHGQINYFPGSGEYGCYRCVFGDLPPSKILKSAKTVGVVGSVVGVIASWQATEALKIIMQLPDDQLLSGQMLSCDLLNNKTRFIKLKRKNPSCNSCGNNKLTVFEQNQHLWNVNEPECIPKTDF